MLGEISASRVIVFHVLQLFRLVENLMVVSRERFFIGEYWFPLPKFFLVFFMWFAISYSTSFSLLLFIYYDFIVCIQYEN